MNAALTMIRVEVTRVYRNKRYLIFTLALPVMMYLLFGKQASDLKNSGLTLNVYYMISMATLGAFSGALMGNATRISAERKSGWIRQLRLSSLPSWAYVVSKIVATFATTLPAVVIVLVLGRLYGGVHLSVVKWVSIALVVWIGSMVFAALSVAMGYRLDPESVQPASILVYLPMVLLGGVYFLPEGWLHKVALALPTWRLHEISGDIVNGVSAPAAAYLVIAAWLVGFVALAVVSVGTANRQDG